MTNTPRCTYPGDRDEALVEYLYGEPDAVDRRAFVAHLADCAVCRTEIDALGGVRRALTQWAPPEPMRALEPVPSRVGPRLVPPSETGGRTWQQLAAMPVWMQAAAAVLCVGVAAGAANLHVSYDDRGLQVRTGWLASGSTDAAAPGGRVESAAEAPWRAELTALEDRLRDELRTRTTSAPAPGAPATVVVSAADAGSMPVEGAGAKPASVAGSMTASGAGSMPASVDDSVMRRMRTLIAQSEQRQQRELALRIGDAMNDMQSQRRADLSRIDRTLGVIQSNTGMEVMRQREMLNSLAVRVSTQR